jgi:hypothetical protein
MIHKRKRRTVATSSQISAPFDYSADILARQQIENVLAQRFVFNGIIQHKGSYSFKDFDSAGPRFFRCPQ